MATKKRKGAEERFAHITEEFLQEMAHVRCPIPAYVAGLRDALDAIRIAIDAAESDLRRGV